MALWLIGCMELSAMRWPSVHRLGAVILLLTCLQGETLASDINPTADWYLLQHDNELECYRQGDGVPMFWKAPLWEKNPDDTYYDLDEGKLAENHKCQPNRSNGTYCAGWVVGNSSWNCKRSVQDEAGPVLDSRWNGFKNVRTKNLNDLRRLADLPKAGFKIYISVKTPHNAHLLLCEKALKMKPRKPMNNTAECYNIVLRGWVDEINKPDHNRSVIRKCLNDTLPIFDAKYRFPLPPCADHLNFSKKDSLKQDGWTLLQVSWNGSTLAVTLDDSHDPLLEWTDESPFQPSVLYVRSKIPAAWRMHEYDYFESPTGGSFGSLHLLNQQGPLCVHIIYRLMKSSSLTVRANEEILQSPTLQDDGHWHEARFEGAPSTYLSDVTLTVAATGPAAIGLVRVCTPGDDARVLKLKDKPWTNYSCSLLPDQEKTLKPGAADPNATCPGCVKALERFWNREHIQCTNTTVCFLDEKDGQKCACEPGCKGDRCEKPIVKLTKRPTVEAVGPTSVRLAVDSLQTTWKNVPAEMVTFHYKKRNTATWIEDERIIRRRESFELTNLTPDQEYDISYQIYFPSSPLGTHKEPFTSVTTNCTQAVFSVEHTTQTKIVVKYKFEENVCRPQNYELRATDITGNSFNFTSLKNLQREPIDEFEVTDLHPFTNYSITIKHRGKVMKNLSARTKQQEPPPVTDLQIYAANGNTVWVRFKGPDHNSFRGNLTGFYVSVDGSEQRNFFSSTHHCAAWKEFYCAWYTGRFGRGTRNIRVAAVNEDGLAGKYTSTITDAKAKASSPPLYLNYTWDDENRNLQLRWGHPDLPGAPLTSFSVSVERLNSSLVDTEGLQATMFFNKTIEKEQPEYTFEVRSLLPSSHFIVSVRAVGEKVGPGEPVSRDLDTPDAAPKFPEGTELEIAASSTLLTFRLTEKKPYFLVKERSACFVVLEKSDGIPPPEVQTTNFTNLTTMLLHNVSSYSSDSPFAMWIAAKVQCHATGNVTVGKTEEKATEGGDSEEPKGDSGPFGNISIVNPPLQPYTRYKVMLVAVNLGEGGKLLVGRPLETTLSLSADGRAETSGGGGGWGYSAPALLLLLLVPLVVFLYRRRERSNRTVQTDVVPLQERRKKKKKKVAFPAADEEVIKKALPPLPLMSAAFPIRPPPARPAPRPHPQSKTVALVEPEVPSHRVAVARFETYARSTAASGELARQHALFPRGLHQPSEAGKRPENKPKNRYANLLPYDATRVKLRYPLQPSCPPRPDPQYANIPGAKDDPQYENIPGMQDEQQYAVILPKGDDPQYVNIDEVQGSASWTPAPVEPGADYINANSIEGYGGRRYIVTQGPTPDTVAHFWHCVWQEDVHTIVMLTDLVEEGKTKCEQYWPEPGKPLQVGHGLLVRAAASERIRAHSVERNIILTLQFGKDGDMAGQVQEREVLQLQCTSWPDHSVPVNITPVARLLRMVRDRVRSKDPGRLDEIRPLLVHCSAGAGRSGTLVLADTCADMAAAEGAVDPLLLLGRIRACRANLVDNAEQFIFAHALLLELLLEDGTAVAGRGDVREAVQRMRNQGLLDRQFLRLARHPPLPLSPSLLKQIAEKKHEFDPRLDRSPDILPGAVGVVLLRPMGEGDSQYVNAVWVDDVERRNAAIATQLPLPSTTSTLWGLVTQSHAPLIVALHRPAPDDPQSPSWFPEGVREAVVALPGGVELKLLDSDALPHCTRLRVRATLPENVEAVVEILQMEGWAWDRPLPPSPSALLALWREVDRRRSSTHPFIVLCRDGAWGCGLFLALDHTLQLLQLEGSLDPADAIRTLRPPRPAFVTQQEQFEFLFDAAVEHIQQFHTYANIP